MTSNKTSVEDKQNAVEDKGQVEDESSSNADDSTRSKQSELSSDEKAKAEHKERVFQGMIDSETLAVIKGEKTLDQVHGAVKDEVTARLGNKVKPETSDEDKIANRVEERLELKSIISEIEEDSRGEAQGDYDAFIKEGKTPEVAREKLRKLYDVKTKSEYENFGQRSQKAGGASKVKVEDLTKNATPAEKRMLKAFGITK